MVRSCLTLAVLLAACGPVAAQRVQIDPPVSGRPEDFSWIVGKYQAPGVSADRTEVQVEEPITLRVDITGEGPEQYAPRRKTLQIFSKGIEQDFFVQPMPDEDRVDRARKTWTFVFRLRPKHEKVSAIDGLRLVIYNPEHRGKNKYVPLFVDAIPIKVTPRSSKAEEIEIPLEGAPASFYSTASRSEVLAPATSWMPPPWLAGFVLIVPPLAALGGIMIWLRLTPSASRRRQHLRSEAARRVLANLPADESLFEAVLCYLQDRFDYTLSNPTPIEVAAFFKRRGFAPSVCAEGAAVFQQWDVVRFAEAASTDWQRLGDKASHWIKSLEADPCAAST